MAQYPPQYPQSYQNYPQQGQSYQQPDYSQQAFPASQQPFPEYHNQMQPDGASLHPVLQSPPGTSLPDPPMLVAQLAIQQQLGDLRAVYTPRITSRSLLVSIIGVLVVIDIVLIILFFTRFQNINRFFLLTLAGPALGIFYAINAAKYSTHRAYLYTSGFIYTYEEKYELAHWGDVSEVYHHWTRQGSGELAHHYTVKRNDGSLIKLGTATNSIFANAIELGTIIEYEVAQSLFPHAQAAFNAGQEMNFGNIKLNLHGLHCGRVTLTWDQIEKVEAQQGNVVVKQKDGHSRQLPGVRVTATPNLSLLSQMAAYAIGTYW